MNIIEMLRKSMILKIPVLVIPIGEPFTNHKFPGVVTDIEDDLIIRFDNGLVCGINYIKEVLPTNEWGWNNG